MLQAVLLLHISTSLRFIEGFNSGLTFWLIKFMYYTVITGV